LHDSWQVKQTAKPAYIHLFTFLFTIYLNSTPFEAKFIPFHLTVFQLHLLANHFHRSDLANMSAEPPIELNEREQAIVLAMFLSHPTPFEVSQSPTHRSTKEPALFTALIPTSIRQLIMNSTTKRNSPPG